MAILSERPVRDVNPIPPYHATLTQRFTYVEYDTGEKELYDRNNDPYELANVYDPAAPVRPGFPSASPRRLRQRFLLDAAEDGQ